MFTALITFRNSNTRTINVGKFNTALAAQRAATKAARGEKYDRLIVTAEHADGTICEYTSKFNGADWS